LKNCEIDFAVYDSRGNFLFAEELQRGDHHNDSDWIRKDKLKKDAFLAANLLLIWTF
jgi:hypothetical protein